MFELASGELSQLQTFLALGRLIARIKFIKSQTSTITESIIKSATIGSKDTGTSASAVWDRLFRIPNKKRTDRKGTFTPVLPLLRYSEILSAITVEDDGKYVNRLFRDVLTCGEYDKLAQGE